MINIDDAIELSNVRLIIAAERLLRHSALGKDGKRYYDPEVIRKLNSEGIDIRIENCIGKDMYNEQEE